MAERRVAAPVFHVDLCEVVDNWVLVLGWAVRGTDDEPETHLRVGTRRWAPVVSFPRPDVVEYLVHTGAEGIDVDDLADSFVLAAPAALATARLSVRGHAARLTPTAPADGGAAVLDRYADALAPLQTSPAAECARRRLAVMRPGTGAGAGAEGLLAGCVPQGPAFGRGGLGKGAVVALFAIHQPGAALTHAQRAMLVALRTRGCATVVVNSHPGAEVGLAALRDGLAAGCITRADHGRDVASWLLALTLLGERTRAASYFVLCNDSFLGPFDDLAGVFARHATSGADVWGLTDSWEQAWHIQSSLMVLSARALESDGFAQFRAGYAYPDRREDVVRQGEIGLSRALLADGSLAMQVLAPYAALARAALEGPPASNDFSRALLDDLRLGVPRNPQHVFWQALLCEHRIPFVKRDLLARNPAGVGDYWRILPAVAAAYGQEHAARAEADLRAVATRAPVH